MFQQIFEIIRFFVGVAKTTWELNQTFRRENILGQYEG